MNPLKYARLYVFLSIPAFLQGMQPSAAASQQVVLAHRKRSAEDLFAMIPPSLSLKPLVHLTALLEQTDTFSCVYRSLFHAQCLSLAMQRAIAGEQFEKNLKTLLQDEHLLNRTFRYVTSYLDQHAQNFDRSTGLRINHLLGVCAASIPLLHAQLLPIIREDTKIYAVHDPTPLLPTPLHYSTDFIRGYGTSTFPCERCRVELDGSAALAHQLEKLKGPHRVAHFVCRFPCHIFIASIITDQQARAKLYVIDSNNNNLEHEKFKPFVCKILEYTERHNAQFSSHLIKKPRPVSPQPLPSITLGKS